jgi:NodT family efflux transporter outer membrane factor (OMF) lipoprotein
MTACVPVRFRLSGLLALLAGGLAGCVVGPDYQAPNLALPAHHAQAPQARPIRPGELADWWKRFGDPTLDSLVDQAIAANLDVATAKARIREARATLRQTAAGLAPDVSGTASSTHSRTSASSTGFNLSTNSYQSGFAVSWEIDLFGETRRGIEAADRGIEVAEENLRTTLLVLVGDVAQNYVEARGFLARADLARRSAELQRQTAALTRAKFDAGAASAVDVARATAIANSTAANVPTLETAFAASAHRIGVLLGREPAAVVGILRRGGIPSPRRNLPPGIPADVLLNRPDVRAAERSLAQATARIGRAEAALYPSVSLTGNLRTSGIRIGDLGNGSSLAWSYGPSVTIPVFNGGRLRAGVEIAEAQRDQSYATFHQAVLRALEDVENALVGLAQQRLRYQRLAVAARSNREAGRLARVLYQQGASSFLEVLDTERSLYDSEDSLLQSQVLIATRFIALGKALGGGPSRPVDTATPLVVDRETGPRLPR